MSQQFPAYLRRDAGRVQFQVLRQTLKTKAILGGSTRKARALSKGPIQGAYPGRLSRALAQRARRKDPPKEPVRGERISTKPNGDGNGTTPQAAHASLCGRKPRPAISLKRDLRHTLLALGAPMPGLDPAKSSLDPAKFGIALSMSSQNPSIISLDQPKETKPALPCRAREPRSTSRIQDRTRASS